MKQHMTSDEFRSIVIASDDDEEFSESGWVAVVDGDEAALGHYSHCSCYGTFEALSGTSYEGSPSWSWTGSVAELIELARENADPDMPQRKSGPGDTDFDHLQKVYQQVLAWAANR